jgi:hypothetical protein
VPLSTFEIIAAAYFVVIGLLCAFAGAPPRRASAVSATAFVLAAAVVAVAHVFPTGARMWLPNAYLVAGYWLPALVVTARPAEFETWLLKTERAWRTLPTAAGTFPPPPKLRRTCRVRDQVAEFAYLCCYPLVPAAFIVIYMNGSTGDVNRFWTAVLAAGFACYVSLPWVVSRPPRCLEGATSPVSPMRSINVRLLDRFSHGWNTFPSGHVAIAIAAALSTMSVAPRAGSAFLLVAIGILVGAVSGRYHYAVDAVAGAAVGIAAFAMALRI